jgi:Uma2 family endonuclease
LDNPLAPISIGAVPINGEALYEVVNGQRLELPPVGAYSSWIATRLLVALHHYTVDAKIGTAVGETLFILDEVLDLRRRPDVALVLAERWPIDREPPVGDWSIVPDVAIEVAGRRDLLEEAYIKMQEYFRYGVRQVWLVLPATQQIAVHTPTEGRIWSANEELDGGQLLPGFRLRVGDLFRAGASIVKS